MTDAPAILVFIEARYAEMQRLAEAAAAVGETTTWAGEKRDLSSYEAGNPWLVTPSEFHGQIGPVFEYVVAASPQWMLADIASKRLILAEYKRYAAERRRAMGGWDTDREISPILLALALPFASHPDYQEAWAVA